MRHLANHQPLIGGKITDWVVRYETQGRGSVHAHMLWWIDINPELISEQDVVQIDDDVLKQYGLMIKKKRRDANGNEIEGDENDEHEEWVRLFNQQYLDLTNANIWALKKVENIRSKLRIGIPAPEDMTYVLHVTL